MTTHSAYLLLGGKVKVILQYIMLFFIFLFYVYIGGFFLDMEFRLLTKLSDIIDRISSDYDGTRGTFMLIILLSIIAIYMCLTYFYRSKISVLSNYILMSFLSGVALFFIFIKTPIVSENLYGIYRYLFNHGQRYVGESGSMQTAGFVVTLALSIFIFTNVIAYVIYKNKMKFHQ